MSKSKILIKVSGSIAAYKVCYLISRLVQDNFEVQVVASESALKFIGPASFEGLTGRPVISDTFAAGHAMDHIHLNRWADLILACPATANFINKISQGIGDDLLTTLFLAHDFKKPYLVAPAMNTAMYLHPITQGSLLQLKKLGLKILETASGVLACGEVGWGKLLDPDAIFSEIKMALGQSTLSSTPTPGGISKVESKKVLITSGGTIEPIDQMRVITNLSTGSTGAKIADHLIALGLEVTYLHAASALLPRQDCSRVKFSDFSSLDEKIRELLNKTSYDFVIHAAAVSDFSVAEIEQGKTRYSNVKNQKISSETGISIHLKPNFKIIERLKSYSKNKNLRIIGFKYTSNATEDQRLTVAHRILNYPNVDLVIHNDSSEIDRSSGRHRFTIFGSRQTLPCSGIEEMLQGLDQHIFGGSL